MRRFGVDHMVFLTCICSKNTLCNGSFRCVEAPTFGPRKLKNVWF